MNTLIKTTIEQALIFSILALGVFITYKILDLPDLSVEGSFPFGAFLFIKFLQLGFNPILSTILSCLLGSLAGLLTSVLFIKLNIEPILAGILTMTILYSLNLRILGQSNLAIFEYDLIFDRGSTIIILILIVFLIKLLLDYFLTTELGYLLIATGDNEHLVSSLGKNKNLYKILGFVLANGLIALSGALMAQYNGFADISMGSSIIVVALASIIIGDTVFKNSSKIKSTSRPIIGALIYQIIGSIAIDLGLNPDDLRAVNALIVILFIAYNQINIKSKEKRGLLHARN